MFNSSRIFNNYKKNPNHIYVLCDHRAPVSRAPHLLHTQWMDGVDIQPEPQLIEQKGEPNGVMATSKHLASGNHNCEMRDRVGQKPVYVGGWRGQNAQTLHIYTKSDINKKHLAQFTRAFNIQFSWMKESN